jgi:hypothetical protein
MMVDDDLLAEARHDCGQVEKDKRVLVAKSFCVVDQNDTDWIQAINRRPRISVAKFRRALRSLLEERVTWEFAVNRRNIRAAYCYLFFEIHRWRIIS